MTCPKPFRAIPLLLCLAAAALAGPAAAVNITLYDGTAGNGPADQPWMSKLLVFGSETIVPGVGVDLDTTATGNIGRGGYSNYNPATNLPVNPAFPVLDRGLGFSVSFEVQVNAESHSASDDRAGFSVIALGSDNKGIELGFWTDTIWAQDDSPLFTHAEEALFDTSSGAVLYELAILGDLYTLSSGGTVLLQDAVRDYTAFGGVPYTLSNYLFFGDDTGSAQADVTLGTILVSATEPAAVPLPSVGLLMLLGIAGIWRQSALRRRDNTGQESVVGGAESFSLPLFRADS